MGKRATPEKVENFRRDYQLLRTLFEQKEIAARMGVSSANLSSYQKRRNPGKDFLRKFYSIFEQELTELANKLEEPPQEFKRPDDRDDHIHTLKLNNETLRNGFEGMLENNTRLTDYYDKLSNSQIELMNMLRQAFPLASAPNEEAKSQRQTVETGGDEGE